MGYRGRNERTIAPPEPTVNEPDENQTEKSKRGELPGGLDHGSWYIGPIAEIDGMRHMLRCWKSRMYGKRAGVDSTA